VRGFLEIKKRFSIARRAGLKKLKTPEKYKELSYKQNIFVNNEKFWPVCRRLLLK
jgi:hypothetical protein